MITNQQNTNKYKQKVWASQSTFFLPFQWTPYIFTDWRCWTSPEDVKDWLLWWVNNSKSALESLYQPVSYISTWITGTGRRENINCKRSNLDTPKRATAKEHIIYNYTICNIHNICIYNKVPADHVHYLHNKLVQEYKNISYWLWFCWSHSAQMSSKLRSCLTPVGKKSEIWLPTIYYATPWSSFLVHLHFGNKGPQ